MVGSFLAPKWPLMVPFCGIDHQKSNFSLIYDTLSVRGCWGQTMLLFWKLVEETQKSTPPEPTWHHNLIELWILLPLRADLFVTLQYGIPCTWIFFCKSSSCEPDLLSFPLAVGEDLAEVFTWASNLSTSLSFSINFTRVVFKSLCNSSIFCS